MRFSCQQCPELCASRSQIVLPTPNRQEQGGLIAIGEAPGGDEDRLGEGFVGRAGKTLDALLAAEGIGRTDYGRANIVRCRPQDNRKPTSGERDRCLPYLCDFLLAQRPQVLLLVGGTPSAAFLGKGNLFDLIQETASQPGFSASRCLPALQPLARLPGLCIVPMPHTSPLAFNRNAPNGERWQEIGRQQVRLAVRLLGA
jgi:DNA polymerase